MSLRLAKPVIRAAVPWPQEGTEALGGFVTKSVTLDAREGNAEPTIWREGDQVFNRIGLKNDGTVALAEGPPPDVHCPIFVSLAGGSWVDLQKMVALLDSLPWVYGYELNLSCPNAVDRRPCDDLNDTGGRVAYTREITNKPLIAKLAPEADVNIVEAAWEAIRAGADAITMGNTFRANRDGYACGMSGRAVKPLVLSVVKRLADLPVPLIACGGIYSAEDALDMMSAGASYVQIGSACWDNPYACANIAKSIQLELAL